MKNIFIIIPTLNPNLNLLDKLITNLQKEFENILVVDDGCREEYHSYFQKLTKQKVIVLHHYLNMGKGRALKDAFNYLLNTYPNLKGVVTADSDGQHSVLDIKKCAKEVLQNPHHLILGCRNFECKNVPSRNKFGNKTTRGIFKVFLGLNISDTQTGLRGLSKEIMVKFLTTKGERFEYETNQLIETIEKKIPIKEIPIKTIYGEAISESHYNPLSDSLAIFKLFLKYIFASFSAFVVDISLFSLFNMVLGINKQILTATILARIISGLYNYFINAKLVFKKSNETSFIKYALLCVIQMFISGLLVNHLASIIKIKAVLIKIVVDLIIFVINFIIQREVIFKNETK